MPEEPADSKLYYSMGEVAQMFDVNHSLIRYWDKEFDIIQPKKNRKGNRLFTKKDLEAFRLIYHLVKERGFTLEGARKKIKEDRHGAKNEQELVHSLKQIRSFLIDLKDSLD